MFNKEIKVVDCTVRDGGLINKWQFETEMVREVYKSINESGVDYMELGYRASEKMFPPSEYGPWRFTRDDMVREVIGDVEPKVPLGVMVDIGRVEEEDIKPAEESPLSFFSFLSFMRFLLVGWLYLQIKNPSYPFSYFLTVRAIYGGWVTMFF